jgi:sensor domain CHASE-containing protein
MKIRNKIAILFIIIITVLIGFFCVISNNILSKNIEQIERNGAQGSVQLVLNAIDQELTSLIAANADWARWNDTYDFVRGDYDSYIDENLMDEAFVTLDLNFMIFVDNASQVVYAKAIDLVAQEEISVPPGIYKYIYNHSLFLDHPTLSGHRSGIIVIGDMPVLVSSCAITTNEGNGPSPGCLIEGRYLDDARIEKLKNITQITFLLYSFHDPQLPQDYQKAILSLNDDDTIFIQPLNEELMGGYTLLKDVYGDAQFVLRVELPRAVYIQGLNAINSFLVASSILILIIGALIIIILEMSVISRITKLQKNVRDIGTRGDLKAQVSLKGKDELSDLAKDINLMLTKLNEAHQSVDKSRSDLTCKMDELERFKKLTVDRELKMVELKNRIKELEGKIH